MWFLYILGILIALVIDYAVAKQFEEIAEMKGHIGSTYFWFTFILGIVGMLMVIALPDRSANQTPKIVSPSVKTISVKPQTNAANAQATKRCPYCGDIVKLGRCEMCGKEVK